MNFIKIKNIDSDSISTYDILLFFIGIASLIGMILLSLNYFDIPLMIIFSAGITIVIIFLLKKINLIEKRSSSYLFIFILLITLVFRYGSFTHYLGGQDQGLYVNMSETILRDKSINFYDSFGASLPDDDLIKDNYVPALPGVSVFDSNKNLLQIDFYPINSIWMAVSKYFFGIGKHGYSIQLFSFLIVIGIYLLTFEITNNNSRTALIAALIAAVNPAFTFFSRFPVSETMAMAFSLNGFYFLLRAIKCQNKKNKYFYFIISAILLGMFNFIRMSFILYLPTIVIIFMIPFIFQKYKHYQKSIFIYISIILILYISSWFWYYFYQPNLFKPMYNLVFSKYFTILIPIIILFTLFTVFFYIYTKKNQEKVDIIANKVLIKIEHFLPLFLTFVLLLSSFRIIELCINGYGNYLEGKEFFNFRYSAIYVFFLLLSPLLFLLIFINPILKIKFNNLQNILLVSISIFWIAILLDRWVILYIYYYSRYVVSEMLMYSIILVSIIINELLNRKKIYNELAKFIIVFSLLYSILFSGIQINKAQTEITDLYSEIEEFIKEDDLIISFLDQSVNAPIKYYFNKPLYQINESNNDLNKRIINKFYEYSNEKYNNIYILTTKKYSNNLNEIGIDYVNEYEFKTGYFTNYAIHGIPANNNKVKSSLELLLPIKYIEQKAKIYVYKLINYFKPFQPIPEDFIPTVVGESYLITGLLDHHTLNISNDNRNNEGYLRSINNYENYLIYGPYQNIKKGEYNIKYLLRLPKNDEDIKLAQAVIKAKKGDIVFNIYDIYYNNDTPIINVNLMEDYNDIEICLKTFVSDVIFLGYEITKIK